MSQLKPFLVAHVNFIQSARSIKELKFIQSEFAKLGHLVHWTDYSTKAGFSHHSGRSMAVYQLKDLSDIDAIVFKQQLINNLEKIIGITSWENYQRLKRKEIDQLKPRFKFNKDSRGNHDVKYNKESLKDIQVTYPTLEDPFYTLVGNINRKPQPFIKIDAKHGIPMKVETQDLSYR